MSLETRAKLSTAKKGRALSAEHRAKLSAAHKTPQYWATMSRALAVHPNKLERRVLGSLIDAFPDAGWKFNDGLVIAGKIPDFTRSDGLKVVVDVHGDYWHRNETPTTVLARQRLFLAAGWRLVIMWEREFNKMPTLLLRRVRTAESRVRREMIHGE